MSGETAAAVLKEMQRVTKNGGVVLLVEYAEPSQSSAAKLSHLVASIYETSYYSKFIERGLEATLSGLGIKIHDRTNFLEMVQIVRVLNSK